MSRGLLGCICLWFTLTAAPAFGIAVVYEGFDYGNSESLLFNKSGGYGWSGGWEDNDLDYTGALSADDTSLDSAAFPFAPVGDRLLAKQGAEVLRGFNPRFDMTQDDTVFFTSFMIQKTADGGASSDNMELRLTTDTSSTALRIGASSGDAFFMNGGGGTIVGSETMNFGENYFVVVKGVSSAAGNDQYFLKAYGPSDAVPASEPATWDVTTEAAVNHVFSGVRIEIGNNPTGAFDELRIGYDWDDVTDPAQVLGDFNDSGAIDPGDLATLVAGLGVGVTYAEGDINFNGLVDLDDYLIFQEVYTSAGFEIDATTAPEPTTLVLIAVTWTLIGTRRSGSR